MNEKQKEPKWATENNRRFFEHIRDDRQAFVEYMMRRSRDMAQIGESLRILYRMVHEIFQHLEEDTFRDLMDPNDLDPLSLFDGLKFYHVDEATDIPESVFGIEGNNPPKVAFNRVRSTEKGATQPPDCPDGLQEGWYWHTKYEKPFYVVPWADGQFESYTISTPGTDPQITTWWLDADHLMPLVKENILHWEL